MVTNETKIKEHYEGRINALRTIIKYSEKEIKECQKYLEMLNE